MTKLNLPSTTFSIGLGTKGYRREMGSTLEVDFAAYPPHVQTHIIQAGLERRFQQASTAAERAQQKEWQEANATTVDGKRKLPEPPVAGRFPWDYARLEQDAIAAMQRRDDEFRAGDLSQTGNLVSALERRAMAIAEPIVRAAFARSQREASAENVANGVQVLLASPKGEGIRAEAKRQMEQERDAAANVGDDVLDILSVA